jgi:hypothetical protein
MRILRAIDGYFYAPAPPERLALLRIAVGTFSLVYLIARFRAITSVAKFQPAEFAPIGVVRWLSHPVPPSLVVILTLLSLVAGGAFVAGYRYRLSGPLFAILFLWITSYRSSWGMVFHVENLTALHLLLLAGAPAADALSVDARRDTTFVPSHGRYGWSIRAMAAITVATYVLAGVAKLKIAGLDWMNGDYLRQQIAHDNLRKIEVGSIHAPLGAAMVRYSAPFTALAMMSLCLELGAPLALWGRRSARVWVAGAWLFHLGVAVLMAIIFPYQLALVAFLPFFELDRWSYVRRAVAKLAPMWRRARN